MKRLILPIVAGALVAWGIIGIASCYYQDIDWETWYNDSPWISAQVADTCDFAFTYQNPKFIQMFPVHNKDLNNAPDIWFEMGGLEEHVVTGGEFIQTGQAAFEKICNAHYASIGETIDEFLYFGEVDVDSVAGTFSPDFTVYLVGVDTKMPSWFWIIAGDVTSGGQKLQIVNYTNYNISLNDHDDALGIFQTLQSVKRISTFGVDSAALAEGLQFLIDTCATGDRIQYSVPIDSTQISALEALGWEMQDVQ